VIDEGGKMNFFLYLYYKERRQLKAFLTQTGPVLPLTSDPPVTCFWKWIGWKDYEVPKNRNLKSVSAKNEIFSHRVRSLPMSCTHAISLFPPSVIPPPFCIHLSHCLELAHWIPLA
jgi:hypothetical protein